jgi:hypothetical protein
MEPWRAIDAHNECMEAQNGPWSLEGLLASGRRFASLDEEQDSDPDPN